MTGSDLDQALSQIQQIETFCTACEAFPLPPFPLPQNPVRAAGIDPDIWSGLGVVGLWATLDVCAERRRENLKGPLPDRLAPIIGVDLLLQEIEDLRHLFAHNFAGVADAKYFESKESQSPARQA